MRKPKLAQDASSSVSLPEHCFWVHHGPVVASLRELRDALPLLSEEQFAHHVNGEKHDFAQWVDETLQNKELAQKMRKSATKRGLARLLTLHIS